MTGWFRSGSTAAEAASRPDRVGRLALPFWTTATAKRQLRLLAAVEGHDPAGAADRRLFAERGKPPVA